MGFDIVSSYHESCRVGCLPLTRIQLIQLVGCFEGNCFYNDTPNEAIKRGALEFDNPLDIKQEDIKLGIHNWQSHGIAGRGVLIDMVSWYTRNVDQLPYDPWKKHAGKYRPDIARGIGI
jgi:hypothetical protein